MMRIPLTALAHEAVRSTLADDDVAIDATVGNGHDTLFLAEILTSGSIFGFDIQAAAIEATKHRLNEHCPDADVTLILDDHGNMARHIPENLHGRIGAVMFNLGYLPGADKSLVTREKNTLRALAEALPLLRAGGIISVLAYTGHPGGRQEAEAIKRWGAKLSPQRFQVQTTVPPSPRGNAPEWLLVRRRGTENRDNGGIPG